MYTTKIKNMNLNQILNSGQIFRMDCVAENSYTIAAYGRLLEITQNGEEFTFSCDEAEFNEIWYNYFDLNTDYEQLLSKIDKEDLFLKNAAEAGKGIRILRQNLWEMVITFIISQQKRVEEIKRCVNRLCERYESGFGFPTPEMILADGPEKLSGLSLGYRERYIYETARQVCEGEVVLEGLAECGYDTAFEELKKLCGVGNKVANCICLFGLGYVDAFPIDTHIKDILYREYYADKNKEQKKVTDKEYETIVNEHFGRYSGYRGIVQQWIFAYELGVRLGK